MRRTKKVHARKDAVPRNSRQAALREIALSVVAISRREGIELRPAAKLQGIRPSTVLRYAGSAFKKHGKDYRAKQTDKISRKLIVLDSRGKRPHTVNSGRAASQIARYWNAVKIAQRTGNRTPLNKFKGKRVPNGGFNFVTSAAKLAKFAEAGILEFEKIYWTGKVL